MRTLFLFAILIASTLAAYTFSGNIRISNDPAINGILTGQIYYTFNSYSQFDTGNNYKIVYSGIGTGTITEILKTVLTSGTNQNIRYLICGTTCDAQTYSAAFPAMQYDTSRFTAAGSDSVGFKFTRSGTATDVTAIWYSTSTGGTIRQAQFGSGKIWEFDGVSLSVPANSFSTSAYTCPTPTCTVVADIVQVIDDSGSISTSNFNNAVRPFAVNVCNSYDWAVGGAAGITMAGVFFSSNARTILAWTTSKSSAINAFNTATKQSGNTCISCGVTQAKTLFENRLSGRSSVSKLVFFMTDGYHNVPSGSTIYASVDASKAAGITTVAIGVGSSVSSSQLNYIASTLTGVQTVFQVNDFNALANIKNQLVGVTCTTFQGSPCGSGCKGFCSCGATCICPQCDSSNQCLIGSCTVGQFSTGCTYSSRVCNDNNACTSNACNPSTGCVFTDISASCQSGDNCKIDSCSPATGCTSQPRVCTSTDPCYAASCSPSAPGGCQLTAQQCDTCKLPLVGGGRSNTTRTCPDPNSPRPAEQGDGDLCKDWFCNPSVSYSSNEYSPTPQQIGECQFTRRTCSNNACTNNTCVASTGQCNSVDTSDRCIDSNPCTHDRCDPVTGCSNVGYNISECYALTGGQFSHCFEYVLNTSIPTCCQAINKSFEWCGRNLSDNCLQWRCLDLTGCDYFTRDCEAEIGLDKLGDCQSATCTNATGCTAVLAEGKSLDTCGYCADSDASRANCVVGLNTAEIAGISAGIVAAIIIAIVVICLICGAVGGKVGLDYYRKYKGKMNNLQSNPLYEDKQKGGVNPFYQESEMTAK